MFDNTKKNIPHYLQLDAMDCGPTCLRMIARYYGKNYSLQTLRERSFITREGVSMLGISDAAESIGFRTSGVRITLKQLEEDVPLPCILHWNQNHFVVCYDIRKKRNGYRFHIADPASQNVIYTEQEMKKCWLVTRTEGEEKGTALALEPAPEFYEREDEKEKDGKNSLSFFFKYLLPYKRQIAHLLLGMLAVSLLQLIFPFLTQSLVDVGIRDGNLGFITLILIAQLVVSVSRLSVEFIRSWILLHMNTRINISLISDFLIKLMKLPLRFFDTRMIGDIMQRIGDHNRIESFLTGSSVATLFSFVNFFIFGWILACYNPVILGIFLAGNTLYVCWVLVFMKYRRELDIRRFAQAAGEQSSLIQLVTGMQEIKLNNCEKQKRWQWERIQVKLFKISIRGLALGQVQQTGSVFFNRTTNIIISFIAAKAVVDGQMTLGMMVSLTYIIGQLNGPVTSFIGFAQQLQDAKISLERLNEIHGKEDEEQDIASKLSALPEKRDITLSHVSFSYDGADRDYVLDDVCLSIPRHKVTAIVGASGSGKTTLVKLLCGFLDPTEGRVLLNGQDIRPYNRRDYYKLFAAVFQDFSVLSATVAENVAQCRTGIDEARVWHCLDEAGLTEKVQSLPKQLETQIGREVYEDGVELSGGQTQRLMLARALYKDAPVLVLDEPTAGLDVVAREQILNMLREYMETPGRSILISSHISSDLEGFCDDLYMIDNGKIVLHEETDRLLEEYGVLKVSKEQYQGLDHTYILKKHKDTFGYRCLTDQKQFYQENYPGIVIEKGNIDELITIMIQGEKI